MLKYAKALLSLTLQLLINWAQVTFLNSLLYWAARTQETEFRAPPTYHYSEGWLMPKCGFFQRSLDWKGLIFNGIVCHLKSFSFAKNGNLCTHIMKQKKGSKVVFVFCYLLKATYSNDRGRVETDLGRNTLKNCFLKSMK